MALDKVPSSMLSGVQASNATLTALAAQTETANTIQAYSADDTPSLLDFKDEDNMASNSATAIPSQQSVKAYVDAVSSIPTGVTFDFVGTTAPAGYVLLSGLTIGNGSSGGTGRANADTSALFTLLWDSMADTEAPVSTGRGASAAADFAANKTITLPDARGRTVVGKDNMGGGTASRITNAGSGIVGTTLGVAGGAESVTLTAAQSGLPSHTHALQTYVYIGSGGGKIGQGDTAGAYSAQATDAVSAASAASAHSSVQPTLILNKIIKL